MNIPIWWLSRMAATDQLFTRLIPQIDVAEVQISNNICFLNFAQLIVDLFADGPLKRLNLFQKMPQTILQTIENLQQGLCLLVERLPKLIHLKINIELSYRNNTNRFDCEQMESWFETEANSKLARPVHWRCTSSTIYLWL